MTRSSPLDIVIAGGGTAGWVAAATFARFLGHCASITLVESDEIGTVGVGEATIPQIHNLILGLGLDQAEFLRATNATFKLGIEFDGWNGEGSNYTHSFGYTGVRSIRLGKALGVPYLDWSHWLPCNSALAVPCQSSDAFRPYTQALSRKAGWQWRIPLQHRTGNGHVYCNDFISDDEAAAILLANLDGEPLADPRPIRFTSGRRETFWSHNCLALGLAAGFMEPLESTSIHLVQSAVARLLNLLPGDLALADQARDNFNRLSAIEWARVRDFIVLHYFANEREGEFWEACRNMQAPDSLLGKIELFREAGLFMREEDELFLDDSWGQVMVGHGIMPESWPPLADNVPGEDIGPFLETLAKSYQLKAQALPTHREFVASMVAGGARERQS